jgi:hypothetical protein
MKYADNPCLGHRNAVDGKVGDFSEVLEYAPFNRSHSLFVDESIELG